MQTTTVVSLLQPSGDVLALFDDIMLLAEGCAAGEQWLDRREGGWMCGGDGWGAATLAASAGGAEQGWRCDGGKRARRASCAPLLTATGPVAPAAPQSHAVPWPRGPGATLMLVLKIPPLFSHPSCVAALCPPCPVAPVAHPTAPFLSPAPAPQIVPHFESLGFACPPRKEVPAFLQDVTSTRGQRELAGAALATRRASAGAGALLLPLEEMDAAFWGAARGPGAEARAAIEAALAPETYAKVPKARSGALLAPRPAWHLHPPCAAPRLGSPPVPHLTCRRCWPAFAAPADAGAA